MTKLFLRIAALVAIFQFAAHTMLLMKYRPTHGPAEVQLVAAMQSNRFHFGGFAPHSYWEMYLGYGLFAAINCLVEGMLFWLASHHTKEARGLVNGILVLFILANVTYGALVARYFFTLPLIMDTIVAVCLTIALVANRKTT
jgi:hypothetical protein